MSNVHALKAIDRLRGLSSNDTEIQPSAAPLTFDDALRVVAGIIHEDSDSIFMDRMIASIGADRLREALKPKPNLSALPLNFSTIEVSIWDNLPVGSRRTTNNKARDPKRFNVEIHAALSGNRKPLDQPDWRANVCELMTPSEFKANMVPSRWNLKADGLANDVLVNAEQMDCLIARMQLRIKGKGMGGQHIYPDHYVLVPRQQMMDRELPGAILVVGEQRIVIPSFDRNANGGAAFPINTKASGHKSAVILQARHSTSPSLIAKGWPTGSASVHG
jgi:hypothetical protein